MLENRPMEHEHNPSLIGIGGPVEGALSRWRARRSPSAATIPMH